MLRGLKQSLEQRTRRVLPATRRAAVLLAIIDDGGPLRVLLTRRTEHLPTHKGQVAFPGGGTDPEDDDATDTALREAEEEVGLPRQAVEVFGWLDDFPTLHGDMVVTPVVGRVRRLPTLKAEPGEVARIFEIPLGALREPEGWTSKLAPWRGREWPVFSFLHDGERLWGLSAYITLNLLSLLPGGAPMSLPKEVSA